MDVWRTCCEHGTRIVGAGIGLLAAAILFSLTSCTAVIPIPTGLPDNSVIFPAKKTESMRSWVSPEAEGSWTPASVDVVALEEGLPAFLRGVENPNLRPDPPIWERTQDYYRQYLGLVEEGRRIVYANYFCDDFDMAWRTEFVMVNDGGDCFFSVKYDVERDEFFDLSVNGYA